MKILAKNLSDEQQEAFTAFFYDNFDCEDQDSPSPWGCPWIDRGNEELEGDTIEEMARNYWDDYCDEILELSDTKE